MTRKLFAVALATVLFGALYATAQSRPAPVNDQPQMARAAGDNGAVFSSPGRPDMRVTVVHAVQIPGHVLEPGQYEFRFTDTDMVVVSTAAGRAIGFVRVMPATRKLATPNLDIVLDEVPGSGTMKLAAWYFPNDVNGYQIVYPRVKTEIAKAAQP